MEKFASKVSETLKSSELNLQKKVHQIIKEEVNDTRKRASASLKMFTMKRLKKIREERQNRTQLETLEIPSNHVQDDKEREIKRKEKEAKKKQKLEEMEEAKKLEQEKAQMEQQEGIPVQQEQKEAEIADVEMEDSDDEEEKLDPSGIARSGHTKIEVHCLNPKNPYKSFVNIGNDCIFMKQETPDFFMIKDLEKRKKVVNEFKKDNELTCKQLEQKLKGEYRGKGREFIKNLVKRVVEESNSSLEMTLSELSSQSSIGVTQLNEALEDSKAEAQETKDLTAARNYITSSSYRTFKELFCPVCYTFACPFHTPMTPQGNEEEDQDTKGFPYNPYILEENTKRVAFTTQDEELFKAHLLDYKDNKTFQNVLVRAKKQKKETQVGKFRCKDGLNCYKMEGVKPQKELTKEEEQEVKRLCIKLPVAAPCHVNFLIGCDKCCEIHKYMTDNIGQINDARKKEIQEVSIEKYLSKGTGDKASWFVSKPSETTGKGNKKKSRKETKDTNNDRMTAEFYFPCHHDGFCSKENNCECILNGNNCEKYCHCSSFCDKRFPGCSCLPGGCSSSSCICYKTNRECDPDNCRSCNSGVSLANKKKNLPSTSNICKNINMTSRRERKLFVGNSKLCPGLGLFAGEEFERGDYICLYSGELITQQDSENRGLIQDNIEETYLFNLNSKFVVDASKVGNIMRYSNHATHSMMNAAPKIISYMKGDAMVGLYASKRIEVGQEILFDYNFKKEFKWIQDYGEKYQHILNS